ncbi:MAG: FAD-binding oxidoreductase [Chloroflexi bacterium]|nr:FAD-binding oxidoreductase [Chloroflexota bacterium]
MVFRSLDDSRVTVDGAAIDGLAAALRGELVSAQSPEYDAVRAIWNGMIDRRPALIARCMGAADVMTALRFARQHNLLTSVRGAGHNIAGSSIADDALMIDLSPMRWVHVDAEHRRATVAPGATLGDVDAETAAFGLAMPTGINSTTGIAGLTLGGGFGWLTRKYGLTIDSLISADVVTADGTLVKASADSHPDLFWALRGGGGNFGIVTAFHFALQPVGPEVHAGLVVYSLDQGEALMRRYRDACATAPEDLSVWVVMRKAPPLPFLPAAVHGSPVFVLAMVHIGEPSQAASDIEVFTQLGTPLGQHLGRMPFAAFQQAFDPLLVPGARNYWKSHDFGALSDTLGDLLVAGARKQPSDECEVFVAQLGGAMGRVPVAATAYAGRAASYVVNVHGRWQDASDDEACRSWAREIFDAAAPHALGTAYVNFMTDDEQGRVEDAYGKNYQRLLEVKAAYDPDNVFRVNQNLRH